MKHPLMVCAVLDLVPRAHQWTNKELHRFFYRLGSGGVDYIRLFPFWGEDVLPYRKQPGGRYGLNVWNQQYLFQLERVCKIAYQWKIAIYFDLFDQCGFRGYYEKDFGKNPWTHNENGVNGIYEYSIVAMKYYMAWIKKMVDTVGLRGYRDTKYSLRRKVPRPNLFGLGNELKYPGDREGLHEWANTWGYGLADYLRKLGYKKEVLWSADENTGHALREYISPAGWYVSKCHGAPWVVRGEGATHWHECKRCHQPCDLKIRVGQHLFKRHETVEQYHGFNYWGTAVDVVKNLTRGRKYGWSDDGTNVKEDDRRGICVGGSKFCSADTSAVIRACKHLNKWMEMNPGQNEWHHIEMLPRSVSEATHHINGINRHRDINIYRRIATKVWGKDITRSYPAWQFKKYGITE